MDVHCHEVQALHKRTGRAGPAGDHFTAPARQAEGAGTADQTKELRMLDDHDFMPDEGAAAGDAGGAFGRYDIVRGVLRETAACGGDLPPAMLARRLGIDEGVLLQTLGAWAGGNAAGGDAKECLALLGPDLARRLFARRLVRPEPATTRRESRTCQMPVLTWEVLEAGDMATRGKGLLIRAGRFDSPFGPAMVMATRGRICGISFSADMGEKESRDDLAQRWPGAEYGAEDAELRDLAARAFSTDRDAVVPLLLVGTPFQITVWEALLRIPLGRITTYSAIAGAIGRPTAPRAVGTAIGRNPISFLVPCHRVLRRDRGLGGYHWGVMQKRAMLAWEACHAAPPPADAGERLVLQ